MILTRPDVDRPALITGDIDFTLRGSSTVLSAARGLPVRMLFVGTVKPFWALVVRPEVNSVKDLKNKVMSVAGMAGGHHIATRLILKEYRVEPDKDVVFKVISRIADSRPDVGRDGCRIHGIRRGVPRQKKRL